MARSELNTVSYFPLYCDEGQKMFYIEETYGNDGFSTFIKILRELAKTEYHYLDLSKPTSLMFLSAKCKVGKDLLNAIITDLVELGKFDKELWETAKIIWCQDFINSIQDAYKKRNNNCINRNSLLELLYSKSILIRPKSNHKQSKVVSEGVDNPQIKEKESKEEKNIIENSPYGDGQLHFLCIEYDKKNPNKYPKEFYINFLEYWTAKIQKGVKIGKELWTDEKAFAIGSRLATSYKMTWDKKKNTQQPQQFTKTSTQQVLEPTEEEKRAFRIENGLL
jgi:hypothetical protein